MKTAMVGLAIGSTVFGSTLYTESFESYGNLVQFSDMAPDWFASPDGSNDNSPATEWGVGLPGVLSGPNNVGIQQGSKAARWAAHQFNWNDPLVTSVVMSIDFETNWDTSSKRPYQNRFLGWMVNPTSVSSGDIFGVKLDGNSTGDLTVNSAFRIPHSGSSTGTTLATLSFGQWDYQTFYRLNLAYSKTANNGVQMNVSLTKLDNATGEPAATPLVTTSFNTDAFNATQSATDHYVNPAQFQGPMWLGFEDYNGYAGNADNVSLEIIPEPVSILLLAGGGSLLLLKRRRVAA